MKVYSIKYLCVENILFWELNMKLLKKVCSDYYDEIKQIRKVESFSRKFSSCSSNNNKLATLNELDCTNTSIIRTAECDESYTEQSSIRRNSAATEDYNYNNGEFNKKKSIVQSSKEDNQAFPSISYDTFNRNDDNYTDVKPNNYFDTLIMENSCNVNIFSNASNSSNVYESESSDLSSKKSQSFEVKLNIESSDIKKIVFDQIFKELVIPEVFWTTIFKKMISIDEKYIEYYNKIYDIYINPQGVVPLKISLNNVKVIGSKINRSEYSHDMFFPILNEVASLIYEHVYLNLDI
ncbi:hypothetical protein BCR36DRAFT_105662 [Piromyces finnis]|uniref:RGS domain-containing protein n=1 Tax=Piromyces finnis TaxID=1754191 RepID=A0A1Y1V362_9FUNG|nr:hypothetical protein BCR36DRAFT_105662 [Piromyces finnis]|eukprot:ORX46220.1 hypothetical protein BCR36DRAFT_105662 [Piromyces finnis]